MTIFLLFAALAAGVANPFQSGTNAELNKQLGSPMWATITVYCSGLLGLLLIQMFVRGALPGAAKIASVPWWAWLGGLISIISTMVTSVLLDHFGLIGFARHPASPLRMAGCAVMIAGFWMVTKF